MDRVKNRREFFRAFLSGMGEGAFGGDGTERSVSVGIEQLAERLDDRRGVTRHVHPGLRLR